MTREEIKQSCTMKVDRDLKIQSRDFQDKSDIFGDRNKFLTSYRLLAYELLSVASFKLINDENKKNGD